MQETVLRPAAPRHWTQTALRLAAFYNIVAGSLMMLFPLVPFQWAGLPLPRYPELWQWVGMFVGVYGVGFAAAASDPFRHWPVVLGGLLSKVFITAGFLYAAQHGRAPWEAGWFVLANDAVWCVPFGMLLYGTYDAHLQKRRLSAPEVMRLALRARTNQDSTLEELSQQEPVLLVMLRHFGCPNCRQTLADLSAQRSRIEAAGAQIVLVGMGTDQQNARFFRRFGMHDVPCIADTHRVLYRAFGLQRGSLDQIFGLTTWPGSVLATLRHGLGLGFSVGDYFQMPGVFVVFHGEVIYSYRHQTIADRPDYLSMVRQSAQPNPPQQRM